MQRSARANSADRHGDDVNVSTSSPPAALRRVLSLYLAGLFLVSLGMRVWRLGEYPSLNGDEAWYGVVALRWYRGEEYAFRTPTGNLLNWLFLGPQVLVHACGWASTAGLRSVSLAAGLLALPTGYWACRRQFDAPTARAFVFVLAILPVNIAYCRFAWDASESVWATILALFAAFAASRPGASLRLLALSLPAFLAACYVHPTNVFLFPVLVGILGRVVYDFFQRRTARTRRIAWVAGGLATLAVLAAFASPIAAPYRASLLENLTTPAGYVEFIARLNWFVTGASLYQYITTSGRDGIGLACFLGGGLVALAVAFGLYRRVRATREPDVLGLGVGLIVAFCGFFAVAGTEGANVGCERYLFWCIAPGALAAALGWRTWAEQDARHELLARGGAAIAATLLLVGMQTQYFLPLARDGGDGHLTFRIGEDGDPKAAALALVDRQGATGSATPIVSRNWWTRVPIEYWTLARGEARRVRSPRSLAELTDDEFSASCFIELYSSEEAAQTEQEFQARGVDFTRTELTDRAGRPVVVVWRPRNIVDESDAAAP